MSNLPTSFDPQDIKDRLKQELSSQDQFTSYDFEGSGMAVILDLLSKPTYYLAFLASMLGNELTLDNAQIRSIVTAHAKRMTYTPHSTISAKAIVDISVRPDNVGLAPISITIDKNTKFASSIDNEIFYFLNTETQTVPIVNGVYTFKDVSLYQGKFMSIEYTASNNRQKFVIPNKNVDTNHMSVSVQSSLSDNSTSVFANVESLIGIDPLSNVYYLSENSDGLFQIEFGDDVFGKAIQQNNIIKINYLVTKGPDANGASRFDAVSAIKGFNNITVTTKQKSYGGKEIESIESIKFVAPKQSFVQNRAVIAEDYEPIVRKLIPQALDVKAWGGEENNPPNYGYVYIALKMPSGTYLTQSTKDAISDQQLRRYSVTTIEPVIVDADEIKLKIGLTVVYNKNLMVISELDLINSVQTKTFEYSEKNLKMFSSRFRASKLLRMIDDSNPVIKNTYITNLELYKNVSVVNGVSQSIAIQFGENKIKKGSFYMDGFRVLDPTTTQLFGKIYYIRDSDGVLAIYRNNEGTEVKVINNIGTINYDSGSISISNIVPIESDINLTAKVSPLYYDIEVVRGEILEIKDKSDVSVVLEGE